MSSESSDEFSEIRGALGSIGLSALIVLGGSILSQAMGFGTRVVMTRFLPVDGYGEVVLGITVLNILGIVSIIGLGQALTRYLPRADSSDEQIEITASIYQIGIGLSLFWALVGFIAADFIAGTVFNSPGMANIVRIFALALPFYVLFKLSLRGIQGHKETTPNVVTKQLIRPGVQLVAVAGLSLAGFGVLGLAVGYNLGFILAGILGFIFFLRAGDYRVRSLVIPSDQERYRELFAFSVPLAISSSFALVTKKSDIFLLGVLDTSRSVAIYEITFLISQLLLFFFPVLNYLFQPIISEYESKNRYQRMDKLYKIITRWFIILTFPAFTLFVLFPEPVLGTIFGNEYRAGGSALILLSVGVFSAQIFGLSRSFLVATGNTKALMYISGTTAILNFVFNLVLIPVYGILGAAIATTLSIILNNGLQAGYIYTSTGVHPFTKELLLPISLALICLSGAGISVSATDLGLIAGFFIAFLFFLLLVVLLLITRSIYIIELKLADAILERVGINLSLQKRLRYFTNEPSAEGE